MTAETVTFTNSLGQSINLTDRKPYFLKSMDGKGGVSANVQMQKSPYQDGATLIDVLLDVRAIPLVVNILANSKEELSQHRQHLSAVFNPKLGKGLLRYSHYDLVREIEVVPDSVPSFPTGEKVGRYQRATIDLIAPDPYWKSSEITEEPAFKPLFKWPILNSEQFQMGLQQIERNIYNDGDAPAPIEIEFSGPALNPYVRNNTTGEFIRIKQELLEGEKMLIDTGKKNVVFVGIDGVVRNVFHWIDLSNGGSRFFKLQIGMNEITYGADSLIETNIVDMRYQKQYNAV